jgi:excisionase family DNA binding protein
MSTKKYLSLEEAAQQLGMRNDELNKMREQGQIRGFADRGTWKFKVEDVEELGRTRQADSDPELPMFDEPLGNPDSHLALGGESAMVLDDDGESEDPTVIRKSRDPLSSSDSDVRLVFDEPIGIGPSESNRNIMESDSDVRLVGNLMPESDSDSDIKLVGDNLDSDSDVKLVGEETISDFTMSKNVAAQKGSDSDIRLVPPDSDSDVKIVGNDLDSDSDVKLVSPDLGSDSDVKVIKSSDTSDSDVQLLGAADSSIALDFTPDDSESASVLSEESGIALGGDSAMMLATESGLTLEGPSDSGIGLSAESDEGITLDTSSNDSGISLGSSDSGISLSLGDSGISLESVGDSGISLEDSADFGGTIPMMDVAKDLDNVPETKFEIPAIKSDDSAFELRMDDEGQSNESTQVLNLQDSGEATLDDAVFDVDEDDASASGDDDDLEVADDAFSDDDDVEDMDVFGADDDAFAGDDEGAARPVGARMGVAYEHPWGGGFVALLCGTCVVLSLCMFLMFDLVKTMWVSQPGTPVASALLQSLGGLFGAN